MFAVFVWASVLRSNAHCFVHVSHSCSHFSPMQVVLQGDVFIPFWVDGLIDWWENDEVHYSVRWSWKALSGSRKEGCNGSSLHKGMQGIVRQVSGIALHSARCEVSRVLDRVNGAMLNESVDCKSLKFKCTLFPSYMLENTASPPRIPWLRDTFKVYCQFAPPAVDSEWRYA